MLNTNKKGNATYDTTIAAKLLGQLESFLGRISPHFHKPVARFIGDITKHTKKRGVFVYDRGGDNIEFYRHFLEKGLDFIVRLGERYVRSWKRDVMCGELAWDVPDALQGRS